MGMEGGRKNVLGPGTRKRTWARSGRVEAGFKAESEREWKLSLVDQSVLPVRCWVCESAQAPGRVEAAAGCKTNRSESQRRGKRPPEKTTRATGCKNRMQHAGSTYYISGPLGKSSPLGYLCGEKSLLLHNALSAILNA